MDQVIGEYVGEIVDVAKVYYTKDRYLLTGYQRTFNTTSKAKGMISS